MIRSFLCSILLIALWSTNLFGQIQKEIAIQFYPIFMEAPLKLTEENFNPASDSITIEVFKCYISNLKLFLDDQLVFTEPSSYHLLNAEEPSSLSLSLKTSAELNFNRLSFIVGVDSLTNAQGPMEGDLDPIHGMYWTWQSGYINFKLEGQSIESSARNQGYQFHLGGFLDGNEAAVSVNLSIKDSSKIPITINLDGFLKNIEIGKKPQIMSPGLEAVRLSKILANQFSIK